MLKIMGAVLTIAGGTALGFYFSSLVKTRLESLITLKKAMMCLRGEIQYAGTPLPEAFDTVSRRTRGDFIQFFSQVAEDLSQMNGLTLGSVWNHCMMEELKHTCFTKEDLRELNHFGESIGYLDISMQVNTIDLYISKLNNDISGCSKDLSEKTRLYNFLGIMGGIFVTIVLI